MHATSHTLVALLYLFEGGGKSCKKFLKVAAAGVLSQL